jgi:hypothetical protein
MKAQPTNSQMAICRFQKVNCRELAVMLCRDFIAAGLGDLLRRDHFWLRQSRQIVKEGPAESWDCEESTFSFVESWFFSSFCWMVPMPM